MFKNEPPSLSVCQHANTNNVQISMNSQTYLVNQTSMNVRGKGVEIYERFMKWTNFPSGLAGVNP